MPRKHTHRWKLNEQNFGRCRCRKTRQFTGGFQNDLMPRYVWPPRQAEVVNDSVPESVATLRLAR